MMLILASILIQSDEAQRAGHGMEPVAWIFMLGSFLGVTALAVWCFSRVLGGRRHFDPDGTGPAHAPVPGRADVKGRPES